jgi:carbon-monoxide dehydrogenase medium subunit
MRAKKAEALLKGQTFSEALAEEAGGEAARDCRPISDVRSSAEYRREMVRVITNRILMNLWYAGNAQVRWTERRDRRY